MEQQAIVARSIITILGAPKEHVERELRKHVEKLKEQELKILKEEYEEPKPKDKLYTALAELEIEFPTAQNLLDFYFDSMPASVEIISPNSITLDTQSLTELLNDFQTKLHHTDMMLKGTAAQKEILDRNAINILHNFIKYACKTKPQTLNDLVSILGIDEKTLAAFLKGLEEKGAIKKEGDAYTT